METNKRKNNRCVAILINLCHNYFYPRFPGVLQHVQPMPTWWKLSDNPSKISLSRLNGLVKSLATMPLSHSTINADVPMSWLLSVQALCFPTSSRFKLVQAGIQKKSQKKDRSLHSLYWKHSFTKLFEQIVAVSSLAWPHWARESFCGTDGRWARGWPY